MKETLGFALRPAPSSCYVHKDDTSSSQNLLNAHGFLVIKQAVGVDILKSFASHYFRLFGNSFLQDEDGNWSHVLPLSAPHGVGTHPANSFVTSRIYSSMIRECNVSQIVYNHFPATTSLLPRSIVRCFTNFSTRHTLPHRDKEYIKPSDPLRHKAITIWLPLTPVGISNGQLIYFPSSDHTITKSDRICRESSPLDLDLMPELLETPWYFPVVEYGDLLVHTVDVIHSSFTPESGSYTRLSIDMRFVNDLRYTDYRWLKPWRGDDKF